MELFGLHCFLLDYVIFVGHWQKVCVNVCMCVNGVCVCVCLQTCKTAAEIIPEISR